MASTILEQILENVRRGAKLPGSSPRIVQRELTDESDRILQKLSEEVDRRLSHWVEQIMQHPALNSRASLEPIPDEGPISQPTAAHRRGEIAEPIDRVRAPLLADVEPDFKSSVDRPEQLPREPKTEEIDRHHCSEVSMDPPESCSDSQDTESITESRELSIDLQDPRHEQNEELAGESPPLFEPEEIKIDQSIDLFSVEQNSNSDSSTSSPIVKLDETEEDPRNRSQQACEIGTLPEPPTDDLAPATNGRETAQEAGPLTEPIDEVTLDSNAGITSWDAEMIADHLETDEAPSPIGEEVNDGVQGAGVESALSPPTEEIFNSQDSSDDPLSAPVEMQTELEEIDSLIFSSDPHSEQNDQIVTPDEDLNSIENPSTEVELKSDSTVSPATEPAATIANADQHLESISNAPTAEASSISSLQSSSQTGVHVDSIVEEIAASHHSQSNSESSTPNSDPANAALEEIRDLLTPLAEVPALLENREQPQKEVLKQMQTLAQEMRDLARRSSSAPASSSEKGGVQKEEAKVQRRVAIDDIQGMIESLS